MISAFGKITGVLLVAAFGFTAVSAQADEATSSKAMPARSNSVQLSPQKASGIEAVAPTVVANPPGGRYIPPVKVTLKTGRPAKIHFTLDGLDPDMESPVYSTGFQFRKPTTLKFFAVDDAGNRGKIRTEVYSLINGVWRKYTRGVYFIPSVTDGRTFWIGSESGLAVYDVSSGDRSFIGESDGLLGTIINDLVLDEKGELWVATDRGLNHFHQDGKITFFTRDNGLPDSEVLSLGVDRDNSIWAGTKRGVCLIREEKVVKTFNSSDGLPHNTVFSIAVDFSGNKWFGTKKGLARYSPSGWETFTREDGLIDDEIRTVAIDTDWNIWVGTPRGVSVFNGDHWRSYTKDDGLPGNAIAVIAPDPDGDVWVASRTGVARYSHGKWIKENSL